MYPDTFSFSSDVYRVRKDGYMYEIFGEDAPITDEKKNYPTSFVEALYELLRYVYDMKRIKLDKEFNSQSELTLEQFLIKKLNECSNIYDFKPGQRYVVKYVYRVKHDEEGNYMDSKIVWRNEQYKKWRKEQKEAAHQNKIDRAKERAVKLAEYIKRLESE